MSLSIRMRLTLWYGALMTGALALLSVGVLGLQARWGRAQFDSELANIGVAVSRVMREELGESGRFEQAVEETAESMDVPGRATAILDREGKPVAAHWYGFEYRITSLPATAQASPLFATWNQHGQAWRVVVRRESSAAGDYGILVAGPLEPFGQQQRLLLRIFTVATPLIVLMTAGVSWWVASSALRPVTVMAAQAEAMTAHSADQRLEAPATGDELGQLARAFNRLLGRLGSALQMQRQFMADASHELRTPVSVIQTATEVTLERQVREGWEYREALTIVDEQCTRLSRMVADMFLLARAEAGKYPVTRTFLYLDEVVTECVRAASVLANTRDVQLGTAIQAEVSVKGDDELLRQLVTNLLNNAVQNTPPGGSVTVAVEATATMATISVLDTGPGIPPADRERVFERFVRLDPARPATSGAGLGLPIARWIAEQHEGSLTVEENPAGGCVFVVRLPTRPGRSNPARTIDDPGRAL